MKKTLLIALLMGAFTLETNAVFPKPKPHPEITKLSFLVGEWSGKGWIQFPGLPKEEFESSEVATFKAGKNALSLTGIHHAVDAKTGKREVVHDAFAMVTWDRDHYRFQAALATGATGDYTGRFENGAFIWGYKNQWQGQVRYTIRIDKDGHWHEIGESSRDGAQWTQFFEMTLTKIK